MRGRQKTIDVWRALRWQRLQKGALRIFPERPFFSFMTYGCVVRYAEAEQIRKGQAKTKRPNKYAGLKAAATKT